MNRVANYREYRALGLSRRKAAVWAFVPMRVRATYAVLRGRTVVYRADIVGTLHLQRSGSVIADSTFRPD